MKWNKKYNIDIEAVHDLNRKGHSLPEISAVIGVPRTTLARYLHNAGYKIYFNRYRQRVTRMRQRQEKEIYSCANSWKRALVEKYGHKCMLEGCKYDKLIEAHHIIPAENGGLMTLENGILLCPNHHAESHAGLITIALLKSSKLLGNCGDGNQQPSRVCSQETRDSEGSTTTPDRKRRGTKTGVQKKSWTRYSLNYGHNA